MPDESALSLYERIERKDKRALEQLNGLNTHMRTTRQFCSRVNTLQLFGDAPDANGKTIPKSKCEARDHPDVQMLHMRRDRYLQLRADDEMARSLLDKDIDPFSKITLLKAIAETGKQMQAELDAIQKTLIEIRRCATEHWRVVSKMMVDMRKIFLADAHHRDRMKKAGDPLDDITDAELDDR